MNILTYSLIGFCVANVVSKSAGDRGLGFFSYVFMGVVGANVGAYFFDAFEVSGETYWIDFGMAVFGALTFTGVMVLFENSQSTPRALRKS